MHVRPQVAMHVVPPSTFRGRSRERGLNPVLHAWISEVEGPEATILSRGVVGAAHHKLYCMYRLAAKNCI